MNATLLRILIWEYLQNLPPVLGFFYASSAWHSGERSEAVAFAAAGAFIGALFIRYTEPFIEPGPHEPIGNTLLNAVFFSAGAIMLALYFDVGWGSGWIDAGLGAAMGVFLSFSQARSAGQPLAARHLAAMALSLGLVLPSARLLLVFWDPLPGAAAFAFLMTLVILRVEYWPGRPA